MEATISYPLQKSRVIQYSSSPSLSTAIRSSTTQVSNQPQRSQSMSQGAVQGKTGEGDEVEQEVEDSPNGDEEGEQEEERNYPALRSKSLNTNLRKMRMERSAKELRCAHSLRDLVQIPNPDTDADSDVLNAIEKSQLS